MEISNRTIEVLKRAGWYDGRKIDITENVKFLEERGFEVLESGKKFMEEFGDLNINVERYMPDGSIYWAEHTTCIKDIVGDGITGKRYNLKEYLKEKVMLIGTLYNYEIYLYISESGRIYEMMGWLGDSVWEGWENIINEKPGIFWDNFKE